MKIMEFDQYAAAVELLLKRINDLDMAKNYRTLELECVEDCRRGLTPEQEYKLAHDKILQSVKYRRDKAVSQLDYIKRTGMYPPDWEALDCD